MAEKVTKQRLRDIWNDPVFQEQLLRRTTQRVDVSQNLAPTSAGQAPGTLSCIFDFMDNHAGALLGTFHAYMEPGGTIGASGKLDPSFLLVDGVRLVDP